MTARRVASWLVGMAGVLAVAAGIRGMSPSTWAGGNQLLWWIDVVTAVGLLTSSVIAQRLTIPLVTWAAGAMWQLPDLAGVRTMAPAVATIVDATAWVLPGLLVLTLSSAMNLPLRSRSGALVALGVVLGVAGRVLATNPFLDPSCWHACRDNPLAWRPGEPWGPAVAWLAAAVIAAGLVLVLADPRTRRHTPPAALTAAATACLLGQLAIPALSPSSASGVVVHLMAGMSASLLGAWLIADEAREVLLRHRLGMLVVDLKRAPAPGRFAEAFRAALADPGLLVGYWVPERRCYVDSQGGELSLPLDSTRRVTTVTRAGRRLAVLIHSRDTDQAAVARALGPAMRLGLENDQLRAAMLVELHEVDQSRRRILERAHEERRRLERNLHDGAQQRVVSLLLTLRMLASRVPVSDQESVADAAELCARMLEGLRRVARGIHPAVVSDSGLAGALGDLAEHSADVPVDVHVATKLELSALAQSTAYEFVATTLADARAAAATSLTVRSTQSPGFVSIQVEHDATQPPDTVDLDGLAVQAEALAGRVRVHGGPGGWQLEMELPCAS